MAFDYDLVIVGGTAVARYAALTASAWKARVALVEPTPQDALWVGLEPLYHQALGQVGRTAQSLRRAAQVGWQWQGDAVGGLAMAGGDVMTWVKGVVQPLEEGRSPAALASLGIDVIFGMGEFYRRPHLGFAVNGRQLRSRRYLIATGSRTALPELGGLARVNPLTPESLWKPGTLSERPAHLIIIGNAPSGVELAQTLTRLGSQVTLVTNSAHLLPHEDREVAHLLQTQLETEGVHILTQTEVTQVKQIDNQKWVQAGTQAFHADEILVATRQQPQVETLNLDAISVAWSPNGIQVNPRLQTTNPRVYACGSVIGGYPFAHIAQYEAQIALKNALFLPMFRVDYQDLPWLVFTDPGLARVGLTETQAQQHYGGKFTVLRQYFKTVAKAQMRGETTGLCKLLVDYSGQILGAHVVGAEAEEVIAAIALAMQQDEGLQIFAEHPMLTPSLSEIIYPMAVDWHRQRRDRNPWVRELLETWFSWRRS